MPTLNITKQYNDEEILNEEQLDAAFDSIETFLNITGIGAENIQDNSITAAELQTNCVTEAKLASSSVSTAKIQDSAVTMAKLAAALQAYLVPTSTILPYAGDSAPSGFLLCDGTAVSRTTYADLFAVIGVRFGNGDGTTTFHTPDLRGRFLRGRDGGSGRDPDVATRTAMNSGGATGNNVGSVQDDALQGHSHAIGSFVSGNYGGAGGAQNVLTGSAANGSVVSDGSHGTPRISTETRPTNAIVNYIIKV